MESIQIVSEISICYTGIAAEPPAERRCASMTELFTTFLVSVIAGVVSCYICKWLDRDKQAATAYAEWFTVTNKKTPEVAASGVFASHEKSSPHFLAAYIIFYFFLNVNMISKSPIQRTPDRNLFPYAMTYFNFFHK